MTGLREQAPGVLGNVPFGLITGASASAAGLDPWFSIFMSIVVFAGASQLVAIQLIIQGAPGFMLVLAALVVNLRMMMYSAAIAPAFCHASAREKLLCAYLLTDHAFALMTSRGMSSGEEVHARWYYLGGATLMWTAWQIAVATGAFVGMRIPASWSLEFLIPLMFLALVVPALRTLPLRAAAVCAAVAAGFTAAWPLKLGLLAAALVGVIGGLLAERRGA